MFSWLMLNQIFIHLPKRLLKHNKHSFHEGDALELIWDACCLTAMEGVFHQNKSYPELKSKTIVPRTFIIW